MRTAGAPCTRAARACVRRLPRNTFSQKIIDLVVQDPTIGKVVALVEVDVTARRTLSSRDDNVLPLRKSQVWSGYCRHYFLCFGGNCAKQPVQLDGVCTAPKPSTLTVGAPGLSAPAGPADPVTIETGVLGTAKTFLPNRRCIWCATLWA